MSRRRSRNYVAAKPIAGLIAGILKPVVRKRGLAGADLVTSWRDIVGPQFAECTLPERINWPKTTAVDDSRASLPGTLVVRCAGPAAILLQHEAPLLAERVNTFLGWFAVDRVKIVQGPVPAPAKRRPVGPPDISQEQRREVESRIAGVRDGRLRDALGALGANVVAGSAPRRKPD